MILWPALANRGGSEASFLRNVPRVFVQTRRRSAASASVKHSPLVAICARAVIIHTPPQAAFPGRGSWGGNPWRMMDPIPVEIHRPIGIGI